MPFLPLGDNILVLPDDPEKKTKGGLIIPTQAHAIPNQGIVHAIGPECSPEITLDIKVIYGKYAGTEIELENKGEKKKFLILSQKDVFGILI